MNLKRAIWSVRSSTVKTNWSEMARSTRKKSWIEGSDSLSVKVATRRSKKWWTPIMNARDKRTGKLSSTGHSRSSHWTRGRAVACSSRLETSSRCQLTQLMTWVWIRGRSSQPRLLASLCLLVMTTSSSIDCQLVQKRRSERRRRSRSNLHLWKLWFGIHRWWRLSNTLK